MALVAGIPHPDRGEDVVAAVVLAPGADLDEAEIRARLKAEVASYRVPRHVATFADQTQLPWLDSGKIDRRKVTAMLAERFTEHG